MKPKHKYKKITPEIEKELQKIYDYIVNDIGIDVSVKWRNRLYPEYRSLLNAIAFRKYIISPTEMARFWGRNGLNIKHDNVIFSTSKFEGYALDLPELKYYFYKFFPEAKEERDKEIELIDSKNLTELQNLVAKIPKDKEHEIKNLIDLRIKSWQWKSKDTLKVYSGSY